MTKIVLKAGDITQNSVDAIINSSNGYLILGSGAAEQIRKAGGNIRSEKEVSEYWKLISETNGILRKALDHFHGQNPIPYKVQKECLEYLIRRNNSNKIKLGDAALTSSGDLSKQ